MVVDTQMSHAVTESTAGLWSSGSSPRARSWAPHPSATADQSERCLTYLHAADFHCLPTLLTISKRLCTLAAAQQCYTYCGPLSKEICTTRPGVLPKGPQSLLQDLSWHRSTIWALPPHLCPHLSLSPSQPPPTLLIPVLEHVLCCQVPHPLTLLFLIPLCLRSSPLVWLQGRVKE